MNTKEFKPTESSQQELADEQAVMRHVIDGTPLDPEVLRRVEERADRVTEQIRLVHGLIEEDILNELLREVREET